LLLLAQSEHGLESAEPVALDVVVRDALDEINAPDGVTINQRLESATVQGDRVLLQRLVANVLHNAARYNRPAGRIDVRLSEATLVVTNTGPEIPEARVAELFEPFRRLHAVRTDSADGAGLGLSIVAAIARAHAAAISARPNPGGGLELTISFAANVR
jgi:signal transduction histidine kinase